MNLKKVFAIGLAIRVCILVISWDISNYDLQSYHMVGEMTLSGQSIYPEIALFRYPYVPFFLYLQAAAVLFRPFDIGILKLVIIAFDVGIIILLGEWFKKKSAALFYALSPIPILIAAFHGQFDSVPLFFLLLAILLLKRKKVGWGTFIYSAAIALKTWPLFFIIPFVRLVLSSRANEVRRGIFSKISRLIARNDNVCTVLFFVFLSMLIPLITVYFYSYFFKTPVEQILHTIRTYQPVFGVYGIGLLLKSVFGRSDLYFVGMVEKIFLLSLFVFAYFQRKKTIEENILGILLYLFVFTPVFGTQWLIWVVPFLLILRPRGVFVLLILTSTFLILNYLSWIFYVSDFVLLGSGVMIWLAFIYTFIRYTVPISVKSKPPSSAKVAK